MARLTLQQKLNRPAELVDMPERWAMKMGAGKLLIAAPRDIEAVVRRVPKSRVMTFAELRAELAGQAGAQATCPLTTGIFLRLVAEEAEEQLAGGASSVAPWWRIVRDNGALWDKAPGGTALQARRLREEGVEIGTARRAGHVNLEACRVPGSVQRTAANPARSGRKQR